MLYRIFTLISLVAFYGIYFCKQIMQRREGISTDHIGKGDKDKRTEMIEKLLKIGTYTVPIIELLSIVFVKKGLVRELRSAGVFCSMVSVALLYCAVKTMGKNWRAGVSPEEETHLVTNGIYHISRNPAFLAFDLMYFGVLLTFFNIFLLIVSVFTGVMFHLQILNEEKFLEERFGDEYLRYKDKTGRYFSV